MAKKEELIQTPQENLERIADLLERIESHLAPPPLWQRFLKFVFQHLTLFLGLIALVYFTWSIWDSVSIIVDYVSAILGKIDFIEGFMDSIDGKVIHQIKSMQLW